MVKKSPREEKDISALLREFINTKDNEKKTHQFWNTQPVPQKRGEMVGNDSISENPKLDQIPVVPYPLPPKYRWEELDINNEQTIIQLHDLLLDNYVEDEDCLFRFSYSKEFLHWALKSPGWKKTWHLGIVVEDSNELVAFISAVPVKISIQQTLKQMVGIDFLCIHKRLRLNRLSPLLIQEITRRVNQCGIFQAVYTAGVTIPSPLYSSTYYHYPLNYEKLVNLGFTTIPNGESLDTMKEKYSFPNRFIETKETLLDLNTLHERLRPITLDDLDDIFNLLQDYLSKFALHPKFTKEEIKHWFFSYSSVKGYLVKIDGQVQAFVSFYILPSKALESNTLIQTGYLFYYAVKDLKYLPPLINYTLVLAKSMDLDVFNCLDIMDNTVFLNLLNFGLGDGQLHYYLFNWVTSPLKSQELGYLML